MEQFVARYKLDGKEYGYIYYNNRYGWDEYHRDTFSPNIKDLKILYLQVKGKNYQERQAYARDLAIDWQYNFADYSWSYGELLDFSLFFEKIGKRYGLLKEFRENAIC